MLMTEGGTAMTSLDELLSRSAALHKHLCPRQVLGVRMGMLAGERYYRVTTVSIEADRVIDGR